MAMIPCITPGGCIPIVVIQTMEKLATRKSIDAIRYHRFMLGATEEEIAESDNVSLDEARGSVQAGERFEFARLLSQILGLQVGRAIFNEQLRKRIRRRFGDRVIDALGKLL